MWDAIDRLMAVVAKGLAAAVIEGLAAYASSVHMPAGYGDIARPGSPRGSSSSPTPK